MPSPIERMGDGHWERDAPAHAVNVGLLRAGVVAFAAEHGASPSAQSEIALAVSEGLSNSVVHAFGAQAPGTMSLIARAADGVLHVRIIDDGCGMAPRKDSPGLGLGLGVIAHLTSSLEILPGPGGKGTELRITLDAPGLRAGTGPLL